MADGELPGDKPITLSDIAERIDDLKEVIMHHFGELDARVTMMEEKLKNCPRIRPNGDSKGCDT